MRDTRGPLPRRRDPGILAPRPEVERGRRCCAHATVASLLLFALAGRAEAALPRLASAGDPGAACGGGAICLPAWLGWLLGPVGWVVVGVLVLGAGGAVWYLWVRRQVRSMDGSPLLVLAQGRPSVLPIAGADADAPGHGRVAGSPGRAAARPLLPALMSEAAPGTEPWARSQAARGRMPAARPGRADALPATSSVPAPTRETPVVPIAGGVHALLVSEVNGVATPAQGAPVADATLQFLPGRLVMVGEQGRPDIRFVRQPGPVTEVTLGRQAGPPERHVRLEGPTVSRLHARLRHAQGRWSISNLSRTNPVRVNGRALGAENDPHPLAEGDRVGVGEVVLVFRER